ncbi:MAG: hypothetical protein ABF804_02720 [Liquorilactobacillus ghanensis]|uniref:hypothetical protein n=1 Tax=Liquorilactobacillus ghanensis TaxID=399370 RepID=UPI0039E8579D
MGKNKLSQNRLGRVSEQQAEFFLKNYYHDRGMLKWQGFFLSDHTTALTKNKQTETPIYRKQQSLTSITSLLIISWQKSQALKIQLNRIDTDQNVEEYQGVVHGFNEKYVFLGNSQGILKLDIAEIRNCYIN